MQSGDDATAKEFAKHLFGVSFWGFLLASLPEIVTLITRTFRNRQQKDPH